MPQSLTSPAARQSPSLTVIEGGKSRQLREDDAPYDTGRYVKAPCAVLFNHDLSPWARLVYFALVSHKGERGIFPRQDVIAGELGTSVDTVQRALRDLEKARLIRSLRQGRGHANRYELVPFDTANDTAPTRYQTDETADDAAPVRHPETAPTRLLETAPVRHRTISKELETKEQPTTENGVTGANGSTSWPSLLGDRYRKAQVKFARLSPEFNDGMFRMLLHEASECVGPVPADVLATAIQATWFAVQRKLDAERQGGKRIGDIKRYTVSILSTKVREAVHA